MDYLRFILAVIAHSPFVQALEVCALLILTTIFFRRYKNHLPLTTGKFFTEGRVIYNGEEYSGGRRPTLLRTVYVIYEVGGKRFERQWARKLHTARERASRDKVAGSSVTVFYSPNRPSEAYLNTPPTKQELFRSLFRRTVVNWMLLGNVFVFLPWYFKAF